MRLLNPGQLFKDRYNVTLAREGVTVIDPKDQTVIQVSEHGNMYPFELLTMPAFVAHRTYSTLTDEDLAKMLENLPAVFSVRTKADMMRWHQCLGHLNTDTVMKLAGGMATGMEIESRNTLHAADCLACIEGKQHQHPFKTGRT